MWILYTIIAIFLVLLGISKLILNMVFGKRCEGNPKLKYFTADDFEELEILRPIEFKSNKGQTLRGNIYTYKEISAQKSNIKTVVYEGRFHNIYQTKESEE